jgi:hypothetical protein
LENFEQFKFWISLNLIEFSVFWTLNYLELKSHEYQKIHNSWRYTEFI